MQQDHRLIKHPSHGLARFVGLVCVKHGFGKFDIPVAHFAPDKAVNRMGRVVETIGVKTVIQTLAQRRTFGYDPTVGGGFGLWRCGLGNVPLPHAVHLGKAAGVPEFGAKISIARNAPLVHFQCPP